MRWRSASLTASSCLVLAAVAAACGGSNGAAPPKLPAPVAAQLAARTDAVAQRLDAGDRCGAAEEVAALQGEVNAAIDARRVPRPLQPQLQSATNDLATRVGACVQPPPPPAAPSEDQPEKAKHRKHGNHGNHGKHGKGHDGEGD